MSKEKIVAVKGMTMPEACYLCEFFDYEYYSCGGISSGKSSIKPEDRMWKRADFCPLIEVEVEVKANDGVQDGGN